MPLAVPPIEDPLIVGIRSEAHIWFGENVSPVLLSVLASAMTTTEFMPTFCRLVTFAFFPLPFRTSRAALH